MNPFAEPSAAVGAKAPGNPFAPPNNPFAPETTSSRTTSTNNNTNPFAESTVTVSPKPTTSAVPTRPIPTSSSSSIAPQIKLSPLESSSSSTTSGAIVNLKHLVVHSDLAVCISETGAGETIVSRREMNHTFHIRTDGSVQIKEHTQRVYMNPNATLVLIQQSPSGQTSWCNPQDAQLKVKGPLSSSSASTGVQAPITCVKWTGMDQAIVGYSTGQVKQIVLQSSHQVLCQLASAVIGAFPQNDGSILLFESAGRASILLKSKVSVERDFQVDHLLAVHQDEDDSTLFWILARNGLWRWRQGDSADEAGEEAAFVQVFAQDNCFAMSHTTLFILILSKQASAQANAVTTKLHAVSRLLPTSVVLEKQRLQGNPFAFARDGNLNRTWLVSDRTAILVEIQNEMHGVWKVYLERAKSPVGKEIDFQLALDNSTSQVNRDIIFAAHAEWHFARGNYLRSAELYSEVASGRTFEEIALKFAKLKTPLRTFLMGKLTRMQDSAQQRKTLKVMLCTWICEIFLEEISEEGGDTVGAFCSFLGMYADTLEPAKEVVFHLLLSHGRLDMLLVYSHLTQDFDRVMTHHVAQMSWKEAVLALQEFNQVELVYKYSPVLIDRVPQMLIEIVWAASNDKLDIVRLLPALAKIVNAEHIALPFVMPFLEQLTAVQQVELETVHNLLLSLYSLRSEDEDRLFTYVRHQTNQTNGPSFDRGFALRLCETASPRSRVNLLDALDMPEATLRSALQLGLQDVAFRIAAMQTQNNCELGKRLWKLCCENAAVVGGVQAQLAVIKESDGVLDVEDLLGMLDSAAVTVDDIREDVCFALERHNEEIDQLKRDMQEHTESAQALRQDAVEEQQRFDVIRNGKHCDACGKRVIAPPSPATTLDKNTDFFVFPCTHVFHSTCLFHQVVVHLHGERRDRVSRLSVSKQPEDQALFDEIIGASCPYCGELMIQAVSQPLLFAKDETEARSWD